MISNPSAKFKQLKQKHKVLSEVKRKVYELDAKTIAFYRRNPCIAAEDLLGVRLIDSQKYILQSTWNAQHSAWCCSRNFGKSLIGAVFIILKAILYENQAIYIVSSVGDQAKETFEKIEQIVTRIGKTAASFRNLKDIVEKETTKSGSNKTGFSHNPAGYEVSFFNGSAIYTLNSNPDSARSRRATLVFFDEAAFCSDELIAVCEAFATQSTDFVTSTDRDFRADLVPLKVPTQLVYASSQDDMDTMFYKHYKEFSKKMIAGDRNYFACDMICDTAINIFIDGEKSPPLLTQEKVDTAMKLDPDKARREYYNEPTRDGGSSQIVKWRTVRKNEKLIIPYAEWRPENRIVLAFDPARTGDNSILSVMNLYEDSELGLCGDVINCVNFIDIATKHKYMLDSAKQLQMIRNYLLLYNGDNPDYEYIDRLLIDAGAGGGGLAYTDHLLSDWTDASGKVHKGLIDKENPIYSENAKHHRDAIDKLRAISPKKYRTQMVEEFIELFELGVIKLPFGNTGQDFIRIAKTVEAKKGAKKKDIEEEFDLYYLSDEEKIALAQIDLMKNEITSIHKSSNAEKTSVVYALANEKRNKMHDDRFYTILMLAHRLYELRRSSSMRVDRNKKDTSTLFQVRKPVFK
ncbi:thymidine kinase [Clostridiales Family XIII bacterium PM5-7]